MVRILMAPMKPGLVTVTVISEPARSRTCANRLPRLTVPWALLLVNARAAAPGHFLRLIAHTAFTWEPRGTLLTSSLVRSVKPRERAKSNESVIVIGVGTTV